MVSSLLFCVIIPLWDSVQSFTIWYGTQPFPFQEKSHFFGYYRNKLLYVVYLYSERPPLSKIHYSVLGLFLYQKSFALLKIYYNTWRAKRNRLGKLFTCFKDFSLIFLPSLFVKWCFYEWMAEWYWIENAYFCSWFQPLLILFVERKSLKTNAQFGYYWKY